jgi:hypothetical protein
MSFKKRGNRRMDGIPKKLEEFPEDFDDVFFHNKTVEYCKNISILRNVVYKKLKTAITDRITSYSASSVSSLPLEDKFTVTFELNGYSIFDWSVIREELMERGFVCEFVFEENNTTNNIPLSLFVELERKIKLTGPLEDEENNEEEEECSDNESDISEDELRVRFPYPSKRNTPSNDNNLFSNNLELPPLVNLSLSSYQTSQQCNEDCICDPQPCETNCRCQNQMN